MSDDQRVVIPENFRGVHPVIRESRSRYTRQRTPDDGVLEPVRATGVVWMRVSPAAVERSLLALEALIRDARGHQLDVVVSGSSRSRRSDTGLLIGTQEHHYEVRLREALDRRPLTDAEHAAWDTKIKDWPWGPKKPTSMPVPTGLLVIELPSSYNGERAKFTEGRIPIEKRIAQVTDSILARVAIDTRRAQERARDARAHQVAAEQKRIKREYEQREAAREEVLIAQATQWQTAQTVRGYLAALEGAAKDAGPEHAAVLREWRDWAAERLERIDPLMTDRAAREAEAALRPPPRPSYWR